MKPLTWRISHGRLPTSDRLAPFLVGISTLCGLCGEEEETLDYLFIGCSFFKVWSQVLSRMLGATIFQDNAQHLIGKWHMRWTLKGDRLISSSGSFYMRVYGSRGEK